MISPGVEMTRRNDWRQMCVYEAFPSKRDQSKRVPDDKKSIAYPLLLIDIDLLLEV